MLVSLFATTQITSIDGAATFLIECGAGLGMVLILRWYWWRINAWSEITASLAPFIGYAIGNEILNLEHPYNFLFTVALSSLSWLIITFITKPTEKGTLCNFYDKVRPDGAWKPFREEKRSSNIKGLLVCWISSVIMVYSCLFFIGDVIFQNMESMLINAAILLLSFLVLRFQLKKTSIFEI